MTDPQRPGTRERLLDAFEADDLTMELRRRGAADYLAALGRAVAKPGCASSSLRLQAGSRHQLREARAATLALAWKLNTKRNWRLSAKNLERVANTALAHHINPTCGHCEGRRFELVPGTPVLSATPCKHCHGTGVRQLPKKHNDYIRDVLERLRQIDAVTTRAVARLLS